MAHLSKYEFGLLLGQRQIPRHYEADDLQADLTYAVVSNTSLILNLAIIRQLDLLRQQFGEVLIPPMVALIPDFVPRLHCADCHAILW